MISLNKRIHRPVLLKEILADTNAVEGDIFFDGTIGSGGYAKEILNKYKNIKYIGIDLDTCALKHIKQTKPFDSNIKQNNLILVEENFKNIKTILSALKIKKVNRIILDLGWGTHQLESNRGFSFREDGDFLMTFSPDKEKYLFTAYDLINDWDEENIFSVIKHYGEERYARRISKAIVNRRKVRPIKSAKELSDLISASLRWFEKKGKTNPSRKTMQAIRIAVNNELENLKVFLSNCLDVLEIAGSISIISFHSLEDRIVKHTFLEWKKNGFGEVKHKKPVIATEEEIEENKASRSAKLRTFIKK